MLELWQAEWCPHSHKVRQRLTELGLDFVALQVAAEQDDRDALEAATGCREIPTLVTERGEVFSGDEQILAFLQRCYEERGDAPRHRAKARAEVKEFEEIAG